MNLFSAKLYQTLKHSSDVFAPVVTFTFFRPSKVSQSLPPVCLHFHHFSHKEQTQQIKWAHQVTFALEVEMLRTN